MQRIATSIILINSNAFPPQGTDSIPGIWRNYITPVFLSVFRLAFYSNSSVTKDLSP